MRSLITVFLLNLPLYKSLVEPIDREISITDHEGSDLSERFRLADTDYILLQPHEAVQNLDEMEVVPIMNTETSGLLPITGGPGLRFFLIAALTTIVLLLGWLFYRLRSKRNSK